jgi:hypothetical protein
VIDSITEGVAAETDGSISRIPLRIDVLETVEGPAQFLWPARPSLAGASVDRHSLVVS